MVVSRRPCLCVARVFRVFCSGGDAGASYPVMARRLSLPGTQEEREEGRTVSSFRVARLRDNGRGSRLRVRRGTFVSKTSSGVVDDVWDVGEWTGGA
jgi:hypothetical protein